MKMLLFRPTFLKATTVITAMAVVLSSCMIAASAAPQFGRPLLHVLDEASSADVGTGTVDAYATMAMTLSTAVGVPSSSSPSSTGSLSSVLSPTPVPTMMEECEPGDPNPNSDTGGSVDVASTNLSTNGSSRTLNKKSTGATAALASSLVVAALVLAV